MWLRKERNVSIWWFNYKTIVSFPYYCEKCEEVEEENALEKRPFCRCGQLMVRYDDPTLSKQKSKAPTKLSVGILVMKSLC